VKELCQEHEETNTELVEPREKGRPGLGNGRIRKECSSSSFFNYEMFHRLSPSSSLLNPFNLCMLDSVVFLPVNMMS
jgi:hypothetical protein